MISQKQPERYGASSPSLRHRFGAIRAHRAVEKHAGRTLSLLLLIVFCCCSSGCASSLFHFTKAEKIEDAVDSPDVTPLISDFARPYGMHYVKIESIALVTGLAGTGEDPAPTPQRAALVGEMKQRKVESPSKILASPNTTLVLVRGFLRPGVQKGDHFDVEVRVPSRSETKSLRGGWLMPCRLTELAILGGGVHKGHQLATAEGNILIDPSADDSERALTTHGRILGGGTVRKSRSLGLLLDSEHQSPRNSQRIGTAINQRFHMFDRGSKQGVAKPKTGDFIEIAVHPRYKDNVARYMSVIRNIAFSETPMQQQERLQLLEEQLQDPLTAPFAAIRLEAIGGEQAQKALRKGIKSKDEEIRFYSAEALAYLDDTEAVEVLGEVAESIPAYRLNALAALSAMDDPRAKEALQSLLTLKSAETRYGAFRALWAMDPRDLLIADQKITPKFGFHVLDIDGPPMIHATRSFRPEIVLFGKEHLLKLPFLIEAGKSITVQGKPNHEVVISSYRVGEPTQQRTVSPDLQEVIRAIVEVGGTYPDVVQALQQANDLGVLSSRFRVEALPEPGRKYSRSDKKKADSASEETSSRRLATPSPELFGRRSK